MQKTIENLAKAFVGESQARNRYTFYASTAQKEGYEKIAEVFLTTADQEKQHAKWLMRLINELKLSNTEKVDEIKIEATVPTILASTADNLKAAIGGENYEHSKMYPEFAQVAKEEGLDKIAARLLAIAKAEAHHEERYQKLLDLLTSKSMFKRDSEVHWICRECGYEHVGTEAPKICPSCDHPQSFYELKSEEF